MDTKELECFKQNLTQRLDELFFNAGYTVTELRSQNNLAIEYLDLASDHTNQTLNLRIRGRESRLINKIKEALERIENGTYGICELCGEEISIQRLKARPVTSKCFDCKEGEEQQESLIKKKPVRV